MKSVAALSAVLVLAGWAAAQTQPAPAPQSAPAAEAQPEAVGKSALCTGIHDREPSGSIEETAEVKAGVGSVYFWTEVQAKAAPASVKHRWSLEGRQVFEIELAVKHPMTRTWSMNKVSPGAWKVSALSSSGAVLASREFRVVKD